MLRSAILTNLLLCFIILAYTIAASPDNQIIRVNPFKVLDNLVFDYDMKSTMTHMPHEDIIVVAIDDATVEALGRFPFSREFYIPFLDQVALAKAVAFDIHFVSQSEDPYIDELFAEQLSLTDNVILAAAVNLESGLERAVYVHKDQLVKGTLQPPLAILAEQAHLGHMNRYAERGYDDGVIRKSWLMLDTDQGPIPSLAYRTAELAGRDLSGYLQNNPQAELIIKYDATSYDFMTLSYLDVINGEFPPEFFEDRIVLLGLTGMGEDTGHTTVENNVNLVYAQAAIVDQLLKGEMIHVASFTVVALLMVILFAAALALVWGLKPIYSTFAVIVLAAALVFGQYGLYQAADYYVNTVYPIIVLVVTFFLNLAVKTYYEQKQLSFITRQFGRYISPDLVKQIARSDEELPLGGISKELSILFLDIRGFTTLSEKLKPEEVVDFLNTMFDLITEKALLNRGTIDKFIGDAAMIIFNAPLDVEDHPYCAVKTAYDIQQGMKEVTRRIHDKYGVTVNIGVGINTGQVVVGNIGSYLRVDYTAIGDNVNIASRIESNTVAGQILVSETTYELTKDRFEFNCIGERLMKGKTVPVKLYEVLGLKSSSSQTAGDSASAG
jgi:adenylate cyclase